MLVGYWPSPKRSAPFGLLVAAFSVFYTPHLTLPPPCCGCDWLFCRNVPLYCWQAGLSSSWELNPCLFKQLHPLNALLLLCLEDSLLQQFMWHITDFFVCVCFIYSFQSATRVTIATVSAQVKTALDASGWRSEGRGWRAETWRNKRTREARRSAGNRWEWGTRGHEQKATCDCSNVAPLSVPALSNLGNNYWLQTNV